MQSSGLSLDEWLARLETLSPREIDLGLERVNILLQRLALPSPETVFHVGGTNGKGSSAMMLESLLRRTDAKLGTYTSPHIQRYNERVRIAGKEASDAELVAAFEQIDAARGDVPLTYFEFGTLAALVVFAAANVDIAILEVGMGGRLDAVNAVEPSASLITNVALDHCSWLGNDIETIAAEKSGIMRADKPVIFAAAAAPASITEHAAACGARLILAGRDFDGSIEGDQWSWQGVEHAVSGLTMPSLPGDFQVRNAAGVLALLESAGYDALLQTDAINAALGGVLLPGRMQTFGRNWIVDVAHNPAAATVLASAIAAQKADPNVVVIIGMLDDKDVEGVVASLAGIARAWIAVTAESPRAIQAAELARRIANVSDCACLIAASLDSAIEHARNQAGPDDLVLVTGSFYLVGPMLQRADSLYSPR